MKQGIRKTASYNRYGINHKKQVSDSNIQDENNAKFQRNSKLNRNGLPTLQNNKSSSIKQQEPNLQDDCRNQQQNYYEDLPDVTAKAWVIFDGEKGVFLKGKQHNEQREMASLTKTMTMLVCLKLVKRFQLDASSLYFSVSGTSAGTRGTTASLEQGEWLLVQDLYYGLMLPSGNDAAMCLAENFGCLLYFNSIGQSHIFKEIHSVDVTEDIYVKDYQKLFIKEMNKLAKELELKNTNFANPHGLAHPMNKSTCFDQAKLTYYALKIEEFRTVVCKRRYKAYVKCVENNDEVTESQILWENTNKLLDKEGYYGCKTGITKPAGSCLSSWYNSQNIENSKVKINIIIIVLGCYAQQDRFNDTDKIKEWWECKVAREQQEQEQKQLMQLNENNDQIDDQ